MSACEICGEEHQVVATREGVAMRGACFGALLLLSGCTGASTTEHEPTAAARPSSTPPRQPAPAAELTPVASPEPAPGAGAPELTAVEDEPPLKEQAPPKLHVRAGIDPPEVEADGLPAVTADVESDRGRSTSPAQLARAVEKANRRMAGSKWIELVEGSITLARPGDTLQGANKAVTLTQGHDPAFEAEVTAIGLDEAIVTFYGDFRHCRALAVAEYEMGDKS